MLHAFLAIFLLAVVGLWLISAMSRALADVVGFVCILVLVLLQSAVFVAGYLLETVGFLFVMIWAAYKWLTRNLRQR